MNLRERKPDSLSSIQTSTIAYHDLFDYPLTAHELIKWKMKLDYIPDHISIDRRGKYYFLSGRKKIVEIREVRKKVCQDKTLIAQKAASVLTILPTVLFVGITGSLAMSNSDNTSDIDLIVITRKNTLWATRLVGWSLLKIKGFGIRTRDSKVSEDLLCMNIWLDEATLLWQKRNVFTAHEIAQIVPIINKLGTYEKFIAKNKWIRNYWPNAVQGITTNNKVQRGILVSVLCSMFFVLCSIVDPLAYALQKMYMRGKISIEIIEKHRAVFHPVDLSDKIVRALGEKLKTS